MARVGEKKRNKPKKNGKLLQLAANYGRFKHCWAQHRLLCIQDPRDNSACIHTQSQREHSFPLLEENVEQLKAHLKQEGLVIVGVEVPVANSLLEVTKVKKTGMNGHMDSFQFTKRADFVARYERGPYEGKYIMGELKFTNSSNPLKRWSRSLLYRHKAQALNYARIWNKSENAKLGFARGSLLIYMQYRDVSTKSTPKLKIIKLDL